MHAQTVNNSRKRLVFNIIASVAAIAGIAAVAPAFSTVMTEFEKTFPAEVKDSATAELDAGLKSASDLSEDTLLIPSTTVSNKLVGG